MKKLFIMLCLSIFSIGANAQQERTLNLDIDGAFVDKESGELLEILIQDRRVMIKYKDKPATSKVDKVYFDTFEGHHLAFVEFQFNWETMTVVITNGREDVIFIATSGSLDKYGDPIIVLQTFTKTPAP